MTLPTVFVIAPTGTIPVTQPTVTWTYFGGAPQERFNIKVFNSAQYNGAGFNVDASTPVYDSGEQIGSTTTYTPTLNLPNADTYRAYVKVAQRIGSLTQWSLWDFTQFAVEVEAPPVPALAVTADPLNGRIQLVATDPLGVGGSSLYGSGIYGAGVYGAGSATSWQFVTIERTADGGATWTPVRSANRAPVSGASFTVYDYETGNGEVVQYRVRSIIADPAGDIASNWSASTSPVAWASPRTAWLKSLTQPTLNRTVTIQDIPTVTRRIPRNVIDVAGRRDPIVVSDTRKWIEGSVTFVTLDDTQLDDLTVLLDTSETLLLQTPATWGFGSRYISCGDETEDRTSPSALETSRLVTVPFNEVAAPVGQVVTFGSTWDDLVAAYATWTDVIAAFPSWNAVLAAQL